MSVSEIKRGQIISAARTLFLEKGYGSTSMDTIASKARVSKRTVYSHFKDKKVLFAAIMKDVCKETCSVNFEQPDLSQGPEQVLNAMGKKFLIANLAPQAIDVLRVVASESNTFPELGKLLWDTGPVQLKQFISNYLKSLDEEGVLSVSNPDLVAIQFLGMIKEPFYLPLLFGIGNQPSQEEIETIVSHAVSVILASLQPKP
jgi:TetR/AcrR family transcriptional repressor of mexJK operon